MIRVGLAVLAALTAGCQNQRSTQVGEPPTQDTQPMSPTKSKPCQVVIDTLAGAKYATWSGWPQDCDVAALEAALSFAPSQSTAVVGEDKKTVIVRRAELPGAAQPLVLWQQGDAIVRAYLQYPAIDDVAAVKQALGEPTMRLDAVFGSVPTPKPEAEWLFADRGLALFMSTDASNIVGVALFAKTTADAYRRHLYNTEPPRELD